MGILNLGLQLFWFVFVFLDGNNYRDSMLILNFYEFNLIYLNGIWKPMSVINDTRK